MKIDKTIRSGNATVDEYIEWLEQNTNPSGLYRYVMAASKVCDIMAEDMEKIAAGEKTKLKIINSDKDDKFTERLTNALKQVGVVKAIIAEAESLINAGKVVDPKKVEVKAGVPLIEQFRSLD